MRDSTDVQSLLGPLALLGLAVAAVYGYMDDPPEWLGFAYGLVLIAGAVVSFRRWRTKRNRVG